jgi:hypothetical protein
MTYEEARDNIKNGDFIFFRSKNAFGKMMKLFTGSYYTHCAIAMWINVDGFVNDRLFIVEQYAFGRRITKLSSSHNKSFDIIASPIDWNLYCNDLLDGTAQVGYPILDYINVVLREKFGVKVFDAKGEVCSEMLEHLLETYTEYKDLDLLSPGTLRKFLLEKGYFLKAQVN